MNEEEYKIWVERQRQTIAGISERQSTSERLLTKPESTSAGMQTVLGAEDLGSGDGYLSVREISAKENAVAEASLSPIQPPIERTNAQDALTAELLDGDNKSPGRSFLNIQDTHQPRDAIPKISEVRTWQVQSGLDRLNRDIDETLLRADAVDRTMREATAAVQSSEAVIRDAERLRSNRLINQSIDVLRDEAEQIESRLNRPMYQSPTTYSLPSQSAAPITERPVATSSIAGDIRMVSPSEKRHFLQDFIEEGASGSEPFIWQNDTGIGGRYQSPRQAGVLEPTRVPAVLLSSDSLPLTRQQEVGREEEVTGSPGGLSVGSPQRGGLSAATSAATQFRPSSRNAVKEVEASPRPIPKRTQKRPTSSLPLSTISASTAYNTTRPARRKPTTTAQMPRRKNPSVPVTLQRRLDELDSMLRDV